MIETGNSNLVLLVSGVCLFLFGMMQASSSLEKIMANKINQLLNRVNRNQFLAIVIGISLTTLMQSSGAVVSMLVGLGSARVITLQQVMGVIIGTAIGTTLTVQLISFHLYEFALPFFVVGFLIHFRSKRTLVKNLSMVMIGFGLLFLGQRMISISAAALVSNPVFSEIFKSLKENSIYSLVGSVIICGFVQSSAVTIGLAMSLAQINAISLDDAMLWVYGANIGTTSTALLAAATSNYIGRQVAWAHFFYKVVSVLIFYPFTSFFVSGLNLMETSSSRVVANAHLVFNIVSAFIFYPFIKKGSQLMERLIPATQKDQFGLEYVNLKTYESAALATSYAHREIMRTADLVLGMLNDCVRIFNYPDAALIESLRDRDNKVDFLYRETKMFLLGHANKGGDVVQQNIMSMIMFLSDLERAADAIDINVVGLAIKKNALHLEFSEEGWAEIQEMHLQVCKVGAMAINSYQAPELAGEAIQLKRELAKLEIVLREHHIERLNRGMMTSIKTSSIHLDLLSEFRRIASLLCNHAYNQKKPNPTAIT